MRRRRRPRLRFVAAFFLLLLLAGLLAVWLQRIPIASDFIDREFESRGVQATYDVKRIGFRTQRFENLRIGDPRRPDLTARRVEIRLIWRGFSRPRVALITARGVRLYGRVVDGRVSFGQVDRLLPPPTGAPFRLPDQHIDVADAAIALDTPAGRVGAALHGRGNLSNGFNGHMAAVSRGLTIGKCRIVEPVARVAVSVRRLRPTFRGPVAVDRISCADDLDIAASRIRVETTLSQAFDAWEGTGRFDSRRVRAGPNLLAGLTGRLSYRGNLDWTRGDVGIEAARTSVANLRASRTRLAGDYLISLRRGDLALSGNASTEGLAAPPSAVASATQALRSLRGTPIDPVGRALADSILRAASGGATARARLRLVNGRGFGAVRLQDITLASRSGARLRSGGGTGLTFYWPASALRLDGNFAVEGGGIPPLRLAVRQARGGGTMEGTARIGPMAAGGSRLALAPIRFSADRSGVTRIDTQAVIDGPFRGGRVEGLVLPLAGRFGGGGFAFGEGCVGASFRRLQATDLVIGPTRLPLCAVGPALVWKPPGGRVQGGAEVRAPRFAGRLGPSPIAIGAQRLRFALGEPGFSSSGVAIRLGRPDWVHRLNVASISGLFGQGGVAGRYSGLGGQIAGVPLVFSEGSGAWRLVRGDLLLQGPLRVADDRDPPRFYPLVSDDFRLTLIRNQVHATAWLRHPETGTPVTRATIDHNLRNGVGNAVLDVPGIAFGANLQPEQLTRLTEGVVALVEGTVRGRGEIHWRRGSTTSTGVFSTENMNLAAAFGPVEGLTTTVRFADLLRLETEPGQVAQIDLIRAGIDVENGVIRYRLLPENNVLVEGGRWPFAGGELILDETLLDFGRPSTRRLKFRVVGLDAERFTRQMGFTTVALSGIFDGVLPMEFDLRGGRIVGGILDARPGGGVLSYEGPVSEERLGTYGRLAFDALRRIRYSRMHVELDGSLAGEFLTTIQLDGLALASGVPEMRGGGIRGIMARRAIGQLSGIPFRFNIAIRGPLRAVIATARSLNDPSLLIQPVLPEELRDRPTTVTTVQTEEREAER